MGVIRLEFSEERYAQTIVNRGYNWYDQQNWEIVNPDPAPNYPHILSRNGLDSETVPLGNDPGTIDYAWLRPLNYTSILS